MERKIKSIVDKLTSISNNKEETESLIMELIQKVKEDTLSDLALNCGTVEQSYSDNTYEVIKTDRGMLFHQYGGYSIFATPNITSLYSALEHLLDSDKTFENKEEEEKHNSIMSAITHCLSVPLLAFTNIEYMYEVAIKNIEFMEKTYNELMDKPLQVETKEEDELFKEATIALETIKVEGK